MRIFKPFIAALFVLTFSTAQASTTEVSRLQGVIEAAVEALYGECCAQLDLNEKQKKVRQAIESEYELNVVIRRAIGRNWRLLEPAQQERVLELVKQLVVKAYVSGMNGKARPDIQLGEVIPVSDKRIEIPSKVQLDDKTYNVLYRLGKMKSGWEIYDIVAEDISVVSNYRDQIDDHFRKGTAAELITKLENLLTKEDLNEDLKL